MAQSGKRRRKSTIKKNYNTGKVTSTKRTGARSSASYSASRRNASRRTATVRTSAPQKSSRNIKTSEKSSLHRQNTTKVNRIPQVTARSTNAVPVSVKKRSSTKKSWADFNKKYKENSRTLAGDMDYTFLSFVILIVAAGLIMLLSASAPSSAVTYNGNSYYLFLKQLISVVLGLIGMWIVSRINYDRYTKYVPMMMIVCVFLLILVAIPFIGKTVNGSRRWLPIPGAQIQPSEFMKPVIAMYFAMLISQNKYDVKKLKGVSHYFAWLIVIAFLMLIEPHLSGAIIIFGIGLVILIAAGMPVKPLFFGVVPAGGIAIFAVYKMSQVRWSRIVSFIKPFSDIQKTGYQVAQALYAIGSGGIFGKGLGQSVQKYSYLPEPYNDFIFAIVCEELGLFGALCVIALFAALILRALRIAMHAPDTYSMLVALGITAQVAIQTVLNIAVATSSVPNTGVSLPFFSYGGTSIFTLLIEMGILLNISRYSNKYKEIKT